MQNNIIELLPDTDLETYIELFKALESLHLQSKYIQSNPVITTSVYATPRM